MNKPLVSVIICVYNGAAFIEDAIQSVLKQTYPNYELIVVDDGSSDGTAEIVSGHPQVILLSHNTNQGLPIARNTGIQAAIGKYVTFLDADDQWPPKKLETQVEFHRKNPQYRFSYTLERFVYDGEVQQPNWTKKQVFQEDHVAYCAGSMLIERSLFDVIGLFKPNYRDGDTTDWIFRAKDQGFVGGIVREVLLFRRIHKDNISANINQEVKTLLTAVKASISRQKKKHGVSHSQKNKDAHE